MKQENIYIDTSAYLCVLFNEKESNNILKIIHNNNLCSSVFLILEAQRNLVKLTREKILSEEFYNKSISQLEIDIEKFILCDLTLDISMNYKFPTISSPKSSDLVHLRTALWFHEQNSLKYFLSLDINQLKSAKELGLPITKLITF
jgi:PIN domain nuclease of toxin-antitoxin system